MLLKTLVWALLLKLVTASDDDFIFNGFRGANLSLHGDASISPDGLLVLTNSSFYDKGHAFYPSPLRFRKAPAGNVVSFSSTFAFVIVSDNPEFSTDGFAFVLSPSKDFSGSFSNQYLGLVNSTSNGLSSNHIVAIEFDTMKNPELGDIDNNHVGIDINGVVSNKSLPAGYFRDDNGTSESLSLKNGETMQVWVEYDGEAPQLNVTLSTIKMPRPNRPLLSLNINLSSVFSEAMYVGFSASGASNGTYHYILGWRFDAGVKTRLSLDRSRLPSPPQPPSASTTTLKTLKIWLPIAISMLVLVAFAAATFFVMRKNKYAELLEDWELDLGPHRLSYKDIFKATKGFKDNELIGVGGFGRVYKGVLPTSNIEAAVKRVSHDSKQGIREFIAELASLGRLRHRNLVQLLGYCRRKGELLLVYDFMPNGSLDLHLFDATKPTLKWEKRFQIIKGVASGLLYLHEDWEQVVIHRDVKASNVLLDREFNGRLGDFGLARLYDHGADPQTTRVVGTVGYIAPELTQTGTATTATDVFAFGVFLLEVACGRRPIVPKAPEQVILVDWVLECWRRGAILETADAKLGGEYEKEEMELVLKLGLWCSRSVASARPGMRQVNQFLDGDLPLPELLLSLWTAPTDLALIQGEGSSDSITSYPSSVNQFLDGDFPLPELLLSLWTAPTGLALIQGEGSSDSITSYPSSVATVSSFLSQGR